VSARRCSKMQPKPANAPCAMLAGSLDRARAAARLRLRDELWSARCQIARHDAVSARRPRARFAPSRAFRRIAGGERRWLTGRSRAATQIAAIGVAGERGAVKRVGADLVAVAQAIGAHGLVHDFFVAPVIERPRERARPDASI